MFAKDEHCSDKHHERAGGTDGTGDGERQTLDTEIAHYPSRKHYSRLAENAQMPGGIAAEHRCIANNPHHHDGRHDKRAEKGVVEQHREHVVAVDRKLLENVIHPEQESRQHCKKYPHGSLPLLF